MAQIELSTQVKGTLAVGKSIDSDVYKYQIVTSVASNNLTVTLKNYLGNDPTAAAPVKIMIGSTVRTITSALSVTRAAATNWMNLGSAELATKEVDMFVYLGYNATDGVVLGFARFSSATQYSEFSTTTTSDKYAAISTVTNAAATDIYRNIGRFNAILSAGAGYTWSIPATSVILNYPYFDTRWLDFVSAYVYSGTAPSGTETKQVRYKISGNSCFISLHNEWTVAGSGITTVTATMPFEEKLIYLTDGLHGGLNVGTYSGYGPGNATTVQLRGRLVRLNGASIAANTLVVSGSYQIS